MPRHILPTLALITHSLLLCPSTAPAAIAAAPEAVVRADPRALGASDLQAFLVPKAHAFGLPEDPRRFAEELSSNREARDPAAARAAR